MLSKITLAKFVLLLLLGMTISAKAEQKDAYSLAEDYQLDVTITHNDKAVNSPQELYLHKDELIDATALVQRRDDSESEKINLYCGVYQYDKIVYVYGEEVAFEEGENQKETKLILPLSNVSAAELVIKFFMWDLDTQRSIMQSKNIFEDIIGIFVSQKYGNDNNSGSIDCPLKTIEKAKCVAKNIKNQKVNVFIREGDYFGGICFDNTDARQAEYPLTFQAFDMENVRLIGAISLMGDACTTVTDRAVLERIPVEVRDKVRQINLSEQGITEYGEISPVQYGASSPASPELFINKRVFSLARWPNEGYGKIGQVVWQSQNYFTFTIDGDERAKRWSSAKDAWLYGFWYWDWMNESFPINSVSRETGVVKVEKNTQVRAGQRFYAYNLIEELDSPGEFYLDRDNGILYIYPYAEILETDDILLSQSTEPILSFLYTSGIHVKDIEIGYTRGKGILTNRAKNVSIADCTLDFTGQIGIYAEESDNFKVSGCTITQTGAGGVLCSGGDFSTLSSCGNILINNHVYDYARLIKSYTPAFRIAGVGITVSHNLIHESEHNAIMYSGNDHVIEYNEIYNVCSSTDDSGAIYTGLSWTDRGNVIRFNYLHDIIGPDGGYGVSGVYLDDMHSSTQIYGNVFYRVSRPVLIGGGRNNIVVNNLFLEAVGNSKASVTIDQRGVAYWSQENVNLLTANLINSPFRTQLWSLKYPELYNLLENNPGQPRGNVVKGNVVYNHKDMDISSLAELYGSIQNNYITKDEEVGFIDYDNRNFILRDDSIVFKKIPEFNVIPVKEIGLLK